MQNSGDKMRKLLMLMASWGLLLACFIAYEQYYVIGQREFLKEDGFRALATLSGDLNAKVQKAQKSTEAAIRLAHSQAQDPVQQKKLAENFLHLYVPDAAISGDWLSYITSCFSPRPESGESPPIKITARLFTLSVSCYKANPDRNQGQPPEIDLYTVNLVNGVRDAFEKQSGFDDVLVTDSSGDVIFQQSITGSDPSHLKSSTRPRITNLRALLTDSATPEPKEPGNKPAGEKSNPGKDSGKETAPPAGDRTKSSQTPVNAEKSRDFNSGSDRDHRNDPETPNPSPRLIAASGFAQVTAGGKTFEMFSRPTSIQLPFGQSWDLIVVGLWDAHQFEARSREIPYSTLIWAGLIGVALVGLSWPFLKLRYMSHTDRFTAIESWYLVLTLFLAATSVMLMLLNASYNANELDKSDQRMKKLADLIKYNFASEIEKAMEQLSLLPEYSSWKQQPLLPDFFLHTDMSVSSDPYPYFDSAFWADKDGLQLHKVDVRSGAAPLIKISSRPYFKRVLSSTDGNRYVEPILTKSTDEFEVDLAGLVDMGDRLNRDGNIKVEVLSLRPMSLVDPVLPPGYRFALIDADCNVLFHSDSHRNMREDFCENSKDKDELKPWFFSGVNTWLDISYEGRTERAYLTSLGWPYFALEGNTAASNTTQVFLLVFQEPELPLTLNLAVVLVCSILMGAYFAIAVLVAIIYLVVRQARGRVYIPQFLFPQQKHALAYIELFVSNVIILLFFWKLYPRLYEAPLLALTLSVAVVSILLTISRIAFPDRGPLILGGSLAAIIVIFWAFWAIYRLTLPAPDPAEPPDWELVRALLGAASLLAFLLAGRVRIWIARILPDGARSWIRDAKGILQKRFDETAKKHFGKAYVLAMLCAIVAAGLVPCVGFFKYSYDAIAELALKRDEIDLSERLIRRRDRIMDNHVQVKGGAQPLINRRIDENWDLYYGDQFAVHNGNTCEEPSGRLDFVNVAIERAIANALLGFTLPTNEVGAQMSKLGVASSEDEENNWERSWKECTATKFQLLWNGSPRWGNKAVVATYPDWQGLRGLQRVFLVLLWVGLGCWLAIIVKQIFFAGLADVVLSEDEKWPPADGIKQNYLVIQPPASCGGPETEITTLQSCSRIDARVELKKMVEKESYEPNFDDKNGVLILDHFAFSIKDLSYNQARLTLLEALLCKPGLKLVIIAAIDLPYFLTNDATEVLSVGDSARTRRLLLDRWATAFSTFKKVRLKVSSINEFSEGCSAHQLDSCYSALWGGLSSSERLVLHQLARDGWANPKNLVAIQQLESKQLIRRKPMYRIINESFRQFVLSPEHSEEMAQWEKLEKQSTWHVVKFGVITIGIGFAAWLLYSQAAFSQNVVGYIAAIATLLTAAGNLFGRSGGSKSAKSE
jgi:hypothetical protein